MPMVLANCLEYAWITPKRKGLFQRNRAFTKGLLELTKIWNGIPLIPAFSDIFPFFVKEP